jgi:hypothetical protein
MVLAVACAVMTSCGHDVDRSGSAAVSSRVRRPTPVEALRAIRTADWLDRTVFGGCVVFAAGLLVLASMTAVAGVDATRAAVAGPHGTMTVAECTKDDAQDDPEVWSDGWDCDGSFRSDDGRVAIASVKIFLHARHRPGPQVPGRVSGPAAGWMTGDGDYWWLLTLPIAVGLVIAAGLSLRFGAEMLEPIEGWPKRPKPPRTGPPQMGNRARRRRRKRNREVLRAVSRPQIREFDRK